jgi:3',5'-cyclic AMP phosphodiesterase CpdA
LKKLSLFVLLAMLLVVACGLEPQPSFLPGTGAASTSIGGIGGTDLMPAPHPGDSFTFAVVGDSRKGNFFEGLQNKIVNHTRKLIVHKIVESHPAFVVNTGDLVKRGAGSKDWQEFEKFNQVFNEKRILYCPVLGNHEYRGNELKALADYFECFPALNNQLWYTLAYDNAGFIMLDSNFDKLSGKEITGQDNWLRETLAKYQDDSKISFVFVFFHQPPYTNAKHYKPDKEVQENFVPLLEQFSKVKFVFSGHVHSYERFKIHGINYVVTGGGGAPLVALLPPGKSRYKDEYDTTRTKPRGTHFCLVTVGKDSIELKTLNLDPDRLTWSQGDDYRLEYGQSGNMNPDRQQVG